MENVLLVVILLKAVCLFFCWKAVIMAKRQGSHETDELPELEKKMKDLIKQNKVLTEKLNEIR